MIRNLTASTPEDSYPDTADDINFFMDNLAAPEWGYSGVCDLDALWMFQLAANYSLTCSEDSSEGDYDPARECFMVQLTDGQDDNISGDDGDGGAACSPFFFVKLGGTTSSAGAAQ